MSLREQFGEHLKVAMKAKHARRVSTLRLVLASLKELDIAKRDGADTAGASEAEIRSLLAKMIRQREESAASYDQGGRPELAAAEREEIGIIREYLPRQMSETEANAAVAKVVAELGAASMKDMGRVMAALKERFAGQMDFAKASALVKEQLTAK
ncbi:MAG: GatB/YqeY domain-containing protein [Alphaproteobacteria bacterium]